MWELRSQTKSSVSGAYKLTIFVVKPDKRRRDLGNIEKAVSDILVTMKIVEDDSLCDWLVIRWALVGPECEVIIEPIGDANEDEALLRQPE